MIVFNILLVAAVFLAWLFPGIGSKVGLFSLSSIANYGIFVIFFFYGLKLTPSKLRTEIGSWRTHAIIQFTTFVLFPVLVLLMRPLFVYHSSSMLWLGFFYLAALPSTVSSSVVMVSAAKGNVPMAIFNASISSLIGIVVTPLWMSLVISNITANSASSEMITIILKLILQIFVPVTLGILLNKYWGDFAQKNTNRLRLFDQSVILLIVYTSFSASFYEKIFVNFSWTTIIICFLLTIVLFCFVYLILNVICKQLKISKYDSIAIKFCGSKKSLVHASAMAKIIFAGYSGIGLILLPIMIYHTFQLIVVASIAEREKQNC
jgi:sodium/bile acid cotransporter 7